MTNSTTKKIKIALVDDHPFVRKVFRVLLGNYSELEVTGDYSNGKDFTNSLKKDQPDIVLLDLCMPVMDGIQTVVYLKANYPDIKILVLTMRDDEKSMSEILNKGAHVFQSKDVKPEEVVNTIFSLMSVEKTESTHLPINNSTLTEREKQIINLLCEQKSTKEIAEKLFISERTVEGHRNKIIGKIGAKNTAGIVMFAVKNNLHNKSIS